ncbi:sll0787 family AIR synthase-like protein [Bacillus smithii]|uniref:sll0787 family AIR synthase-like protein n=1 Tax=Bacillus smithii TaxID=1479 RepID=UPI0030C8ED06
MTQFQRLMSKLQDTSMLQRKKAIHPPLSVFKDLWNFHLVLDPIGDDAAILTTDDGYLLFSCDGILPQLVKEEPFWAGYCAVLVSVSDIYAMGGRPMAVVNLLSAPDEDLSVLIAEGMAEGCRKLGVPMVGGHFFPEEAPGVATAIIGKANQVLRATQGRPGQSIIIAIDLNGKPYKYYLQWNSTSMLEPRELQRKLEVMPKLAESDLIHAARDISNAGVIGTVAMLAENSGCGAVINLEAIPIPPSVEMETWLQMYPGYGFVLTVNEEDEEKVIRCFQDEGIAASVVGQLKSNLNIVLTSGEESAVYIDLSKETLVVGKNGI